MVIGVLCRFSNISILNFTQLRVGLTGENSGRISTAAHNGGPVRELLAKKEARVMNVFNRLSTLALTLLLVQSAALAQGPVREYRRAHEHEILREFMELLAIPNVANDRENIRRNAAAVVRMMQARKLAPHLLEAADPSAPPAVYGEWKTAGATRTLIFYAHYDGQPTDPRQWTNTLPWQPVLRNAPLESSGTILPTPKTDETINPEWRLYGRSAADDKAGVMAILSAFDALIASGAKPTSNLKFYFDGEEEAGSPHLGEILKTNKELLQSDAWIICDGPVHQSGRKQVVFGVRGDTNVDVTVYGAKRPLHSGHYGNWSPNPAMILAKLLASMKDESGRVAIAGWYDNIEPLGEVERRAIAEAPHDDAARRRPRARGREKPAGLIGEPSLNINGISSGDGRVRSLEILFHHSYCVLDCWSRAMTTGDSFSSSRSHS